MNAEEHPYEFSGSTEAVAHVDRAVDALLHFREECVAEAEAALAADPMSPMANVLSAYLGLLTTEASDHASAQKTFATYLGAARPDAGTPRERMHVQAVQTWLSGDMRGAGVTLLDLSHEYPRDALALMVGHQIDFFTGNLAVLRDRIGAAMGAWAEEDRHFGVVLGMYAFGLEEAGHYDRSEETGLRAVEIDPLDVWGIHSVAHTYEMQGRFGDGTRYFDDRRSAWTGEENFFRAHNWWHYALYALEADDPVTALEVYDAELHHEGVEPVAMQMLDAAALLWRMYLEGHAESTRWNELADAWEPKVEVPFYAFNDMHAVMSFIGSGRLARAERLIADREAWLESADPRSSNTQMTADIGLPVCRGLVAFGLGRYEEAVDLLYPIRYRLNEFGGSHAQRDAVYKTLLEAALRGRRRALAHALVSERLHVRPSSPYNWLKRAQALRADGSEAAASAAERRARELVREASIAPQSR